ncbi:MAG: hypothetical protein Q8N98_01365 [bacterium]|nr:hypothetical protein [bacterium]
MMVQTTDGSEVEARFISISPIEGVQVGEHEMSLEHFCAMAIHFLGGGFFGWGNKTPEAVNKALSQLFEIYEQVDGKWVRKAKYRVGV